MKKISEIEGIGSSYAAKLQQAGIQHVETLIEKCASPQGRMEVAKTADINPKLILLWVNMADLFRVKGIGEEYADLLEAAGVDTVPELGQRKPENLHKKLEEVNGGNDIQTTKTKKIFILTIGAMTESAERPGVGCSPLCQEVIRYWW